VTVVHNGSALAPISLFRAIAPDSELAIQYRAPVKDSIYSFALPTANREKVTVGSDTRVFDVKFTLLQKSGLSGALPSVFKLTFWTFELSESEISFSYGIPAGAEITVSQNDSKPLFVRLLDGEEQRFFVTAADTVSTLKLFLGRIMTVNTNEFSFKDHLVKLTNLFSSSICESQDWKLFHFILNSSSTQLLVT
jgi:hypothetical protein